jgi:multidrug efflux pump subunit AcrA (membrane-fusion protein)
VKSLKVDIGDHVESGQLLAEIDTPEVDAQLAQARGSLEEAQAMVKKAQTDLELTAATRKRYEESRQNDTGSIPEQQLDERRSAEKQAASALAAAQASVVASTADVQRLLTLQSFEKVTAPFSGVITTRGYDLGALVASSNGSRELFQLVQTNPMRVFINVPQTFSTNILALDCQSAALIIIEARTFA